MSRTGNQSFPLDADAYASSGTTSPGDDPGDTIGAKWHEPLRCVRGTRKTEEAKMARESRLRAELVDLSDVREMAGGPQLETGGNCGGYCYGGVCGSICVGDGCTDPLGGGCGTTCYGYTCGAVCYGLNCGQNCAGEGC